MNQRLKTGKSKTRRGITLLLSLMVMTTVLATTIVLGQIISIEFGLARNSNDTVVATYAAETALEQGAYRARISGDVVSTLSKPAQTLNNNSTWSRTATNNYAALVLRNLPKGLSRGFDFYDYENFASGAGKDTVKLLMGSCDGSEWIELGYAEIIPGTYYPGNFQKHRYQCLPAGNNVTISTGAVLNSGSNYRLYVRYVEGNSASIGQMLIQGCLGASNCNMTGIVDLTAKGNFRGSTRTMDLILPQLSSVSGVFSYGVFSECQIIKDPENPTPSC